MGISTPDGPTAEPPAVPVFFLSDSTGISAETMGNALLIQFPDLRFERRLIPFITTVEEARRVVAILDAAMDGPVTPLAFSTTAVTEIRDELHRSRCPLIDFFDLHMTGSSRSSAVRGMRVAARLHGLGDVQRYNARMAAVEYAIEHDDGQSMRALDKADVILLAPSRCGKTPTTMYLALQHGDLRRQLPAGGGGLRQHRAAPAGPRPARSLLRHHDHPGPAQPGAARAAAELPVRLARAVHVRAAPGRDDVPQSHRIPSINSSAKSVEEMSTVILQSRTPSPPPDSTRRHRTNRRRPLERTSG